MARELGVVTRGSCAIEPLVIAAGPTCARVSGEVEVESGLDEAAARAAMDGDTCRTWNAGTTGPVSLGVDFGAPKRVSAVLLMSRDGGAATHTIEASDDGTTYRQLIVVTGELAAGQPYAIYLPEEVTTTHLRVRTTKSSYPVTWREIVPLTCPG